MGVAMYAASVVMMDIAEQRDSQPEVNDHSGMFPDEINDLMCDQGEPSK